MVDKDLTFIRKSFTDNTFKNPLYDILTYGTPGCTFVFNKALMEKLKQYKPSVISMHDSWISFVCLAVNGFFYSDQNAYIMYRQHDANVLGAQRHSLKDTLMGIVKNKNVLRSDMAKEILKGYSEMMPEKTKEAFIAFAEYKENLKYKLKILMLPYNKKKTTKRTFEKVKLRVVFNFIVWIALELNCKKLVAGEHRGTSFSLNELVNNIKGGILLTVGNLSSVVLTSMDRWFVKALMTTLAFAQYSFAVSMENFMNVAVTPVTTTLYNYFCKATDKSQIRKTRNYVMFFAAAIVSCAFPARFILEIYLTKYIDSAKVMFLLFAAQIFYIVIKSVYVNLYKAQKKQNIYFIKLTLIIVVGFVFNIVCYGIYKVKESFAVGTLLSAICWYFLCLPDFKWMEYNIKEKLYPFIQTCAFLLCGFCFSAVPGFLIYILEIAVVSYLSFPGEVCEIATKVKIGMSGLKH